MATIQWVEDPDDVLEALDALLCYLLPGRTKCRNEYRLNRRALYAAVMKHAQLLLGVCGCNLGGRHLWYLDKDNRWRERLALAGIDPDNLEVVDQFRWAHAWDQLKNENTFRKGDQQQRINLGLDPPPLEPIVKNVQLPAQNAVILPNAAFYGNGYG
jgi:hypothetical protein